MDGSQLPYTQGDSLMRNQTSQWSAHSMQPLLRNVQHVSSGPTQYYPTTSSPFNIASAGSSSPLNAPSVLYPFTGPDPRTATLLNDDVLNDMNVGEECEKCKNLFDFAHKALDSAKGLSNKILNAKLMEKRYETMKKSHAEASTYIEEMQKQRVELNDEFAQLTVQFNHAKQREQDLMKQVTILEGKSQEAREHLNAANTLREKYNRSCEVTFALQAKRRKLAEQFETLVAIANRDAKEKEDLTRQVESLKNEKRTLIERTKAFKKYVPQLYKTMNELFTQSSHRTGHTLKRFDQLSSPEVKLLLLGEAGLQMAEQGPTASDDEAAADLEALMGLGASALSDAEDFPAGESSSRIDSNIPRGRGRSRGRGAIRGAGSAGGRGGGFFDPSERDALFMEQMKQKLAPRSIENDVSQQGTSATTIHGKKTLTVREQQAADLKKMGVKERAAEMKRQRELEMNKGTTTNTSKCDFGTSNSKMSASETATTSKQLRVSDRRVRSLEDIGMDMSPSPSPPPPSVRPPVAATTPREVEAPLRIFHEGIDDPSLRPRTSQEAEPVTWSDEPIGDVPCGMEMFDNSQSLELVANTDVATVRMVTNELIDRVSLESPCGPSLSEPDPVPDEFVSPPSITASDITIPSPDSELIAADNGSKDDSSQNVPARRTLKALNSMTRLVSEDEEPIEAPTLRGELLNHVEKNKSTTPIPASLEADPTENLVPSPSSQDSVLSDAELARSVHAEINHRPRRTSVPKILPVKSSYRAVKESTQGPSLPGLPSCDPQTPSVASKSDSVDSSDRSILPKRVFSPAPNSVPSSSKRAPSVGRVYKARVSTTKAKQPSGIANESTFRVPVEKKKTPARLTNMAPNSTEEDTSLSGFFAGILDGAKMEKEKPKRGRKPAQLKTPTAIEEAEEDSLPKSARGRQRKSTDETPFTPPLPLPRERVTRTRSRASSISSNSSSVVRRSTRISSLSSRESSVVKVTTTPKSAAKTPPNTEKPAAVSRSSRTPQTRNLSVMPRATSGRSRTVVAAKKSALTAVAIADISMRETRSRNSNSSTPAHPITTTKSMSATVSKRAAPVDNVNEDLPGGSRSTAKTAPIAPKRRKLDESSSAVADPEPSEDALMISEVPEDDSRQPTYRKERAAKAKQKQKAAENPTTSSSLIEASPDSVQMAEPTASNMDDDDDVAHALQIADSDIDDADPAPSRIVNDKVTAPSDVPAGTALDEPQATGATVKSKTDFTRVALALPHIAKGPVLRSTTVRPTSKSCSVPAKLVLSGENIATAKKTATGANPLTQKNDFISKIRKNLRTGVKALSGTTTSSTAVSTRSRRSDIVNAKEGAATAVPLLPTFSKGRSSAGAGSNVVHPRFVANVTVDEHSAGENQLCDVLSKNLSHEQIEELVPQSSKELIEKLPIEIVADCFVKVLQTMPSTGDLFLSVNKMWAEKTLRDLPNVKEENLLSIVHGLRSGPIWMSLVRAISRAAVSQDQLDMVSCERYVRIMGHALRFEEKERADDFDDLEREGASLVRTFFTDLIITRNNLAPRAIVFWLVGNSWSYLSWLADDSWEKLKQLLALQMDDHMRDMLQWFWRERFGERCILKLPVFTKDVAIIYANADIKSIMEENIHSDTRREDTFRLARLLIHSCVPRKDREQLLQELTKYLKNNLAVLVNSYSDQSQTTISLGLFADATSSNRRRMSGDEARQFSARMYNVMFVLEQVICYLKGDLAGKGLIASALAQCAAKLHDLVMVEDPSDEAYVLIVPLLDRLRTLCQVHSTYPI